MRVVVVSFRLPWTLISEKSRCCNYEAQWVVAGGNQQEKSPNIVEKKFSPSNPVPTVAELGTHFRNHVPDGATLSIPPLIESR